MEGIESNWLLQRRYRHFWKKLALYQYTVLGFRLTNAAFTRNDLNYSLRQTNLQVVLNGRSAVNWPKSHDYFVQLHYMEANTNKKCTAVMWERIPNEGTASFVLYVGVAEHRVLGKVMWLHFLPSIFIHNFAKKRWTILEKKDTLYTISFCHQSYLSQICPLKK